jgi:predicted PurR-regulated permease PerM
MAFLSLVPAIGSAIVWVPAAIFLFARTRSGRGCLLSASS